MGTLQLGLETMKEITLKVFINFLTHLVLFSLALFPFSALFYDLPVVGARRFLSQLALPLSFILLLCLTFANRENLKIFLFGFLKNFVYFLKPFIPFLLGLLLIALIYSPSKEQFIFKPSTLASFVLFLAVVFATLKSSEVKNLSYEYIFIFCSCAIWGTLFLLIFISFQESKSFFDIREYLRPWVTVFSRCTSLVAGIALIGSFQTDKLPKRIAYLISGTLGFFIASIVLQTRSVLLCPFIGFGILFFVLLRQKKIQRLKIFLPIFLSFLALTVSVTMLSDRISRGTQEVISSGSLEDIQLVISKIEKKSPLNQNEELILSSINTSMGGRMTAWATAKKIGERNFWFGSGQGALNHFLDVKTIFQKSGNFVVHFHSDFVQVFVVGGAILLFSLIVTELLLIWRAYKQQSFINLFLILSMISFGLGELAFVETQTFLVFCSAWAFFTLAEFRKSCSF